MNRKKCLVFIIFLIFACCTGVVQRVAMDEGYIKYQNGAATTKEESDGEPATPTPIVKKEQVTKAPTATVKPKATPTAVPTITPPTVTKAEAQPAATRIPQATPYQKAKENTVGEQVGWGKANHPNAATMVLKQLPKSGEGSVKVAGSTGRAVPVTSETFLKLYGIYEDEKGNLYRHVGVTYLGEEYYGYILEERIVLCEAPSPTPTVQQPADTWLPQVTATPRVTKTPTAAQKPTVRPTATSAPAITVAPTAVATPAGKVTATPTSVPKATATPTSIPKVTATPTVTPVPTATPTYELVKEGYYDYNVIPDIYNAGCSGGLTKINTAGVVDGVEYNLGDNGATLVIDLYYRNKDLGTETVIRNKDFSDLKFSVRHASMSEKNHTIRFVNCKFGSVGMDIEQEMAEFYFTNCSFTHFYGSESTFLNCTFGGGDGVDGMNPFQNITLRNCYFVGFPQRNDSGTHTDAIQIFGKDGIDAENITFQNCRVEIPIVEGRTDNSGYINACFMVQLEYSNARNFLFENCMINGGGYSIYAWDKNKGWALDNVVFRNISVGAGHKYSDVYPHKASTVTFEGLTDTEKLYVASVWKDYDGTVHLSVTNDTAQDRTLLVVTEEGKQEFLIPCKASAEAAGAREYYDLPIDRVVSVSTSGTDWVVCYDGAERAENQIRFVNWGSEPVYRTVR